MLRSILPILTLLSIARTQEYRATEECPLLGPTFYSDFDLTTTDAFAEAQASFPDVIEALFDAGIVNSSTASFSIDVYSTVTNASIYNYSHQATEPALGEEFPEGGINDQTIFRIGSVSKLFTVYAILTHAGSIQVLNHPITDYLPELAGNSRDDPLNKIIWEDVTIGTLASHMAGSSQFPLLQLACLSPEDPGCTTAEFLEYMKDIRVPSQPVHQSSLYSDGGYGVLGRALERMTGQNYSEAIQSVLGESLGLNSTTTFIPEGDDVNALVIPGDNPAISSWGYDNQISAPSGGIYSTNADFRAIGLSILHSQILSPADTRLWLKPRAHTASLTSSVGAPWEISRLTLPVSTNSTRRRVSDLYAKAGGQAGYTSIFALSPDHKLGYSVQVAGPGSGLDRWTIRAAVGETFVVAAEHAAWEHAERHFQGTFADEAGPGTNLTLTVEDDHPGLGLSEFWINGTDAMLNLTQPGLTALPQGLGQTVRLYPSGLEETLDNGGKRLKYRAVNQITPLTPRALVDGGESLFDDGCASWVSTAFFESPTGQFYDEFLLDVDADGVLVAVTYPVAEVTLDKSDDE